jgi:hypothetical protein
MQQYRNLKVLAFLPIFLFSACGTATAQELQRVSQRGIEVSYGFHHFILKENSSLLKRYAPCSRGLSIGYFLGNNLVRTRIRGFGFYESTRNASADFSGYEGEVLFNFFPLEFMRTRKHILDIYILAGLNLSSMQFLDQSIGSRGRMTDFSNVIGAGTEFLLRSGGRVIYLFAEMSASDSFEINGKSKEANDPIPEVKTALTIGVRYAF